MISKPLLAALACACLVAPARADIRAMVDAAADSAGVPRAIAHAIVRQESNYRPGAYNAGAIGLGQILCGTARGVGFRGGCSELYDPATNLRWSMRYLRLALDRGGEGCAGVSLYQTGIYRRPHCSAYGRQVMGRAAR
jgi:hypothetical protein